MEQGGAGTESAEALRTRILASAGEGTLLALILDRLDAGSLDELKAGALVSAALHNSGDIDLFAVGRSDEVEELSGHDFFSVQQFFVHAIPATDASVSDMLALVERLVRLGGADGAANAPNVALVSWLTDDPQRAEAVLAHASDGDATAISHIAFALQALGDVGRAQAIAEAGAGPPQLSALTALARLPHTPEEGRATQALVNRLLVGSMDDGLRCHGLAAVFGALKSASEGSIDAADTVRMVIRGIGGNTQFQCANALWDGGERLTETTTAALLDALAVVPKENKGTIRIFDHALSQMLDHRPKTAIEVCARFLTRPDNDHALADFASFSTGLINSPRFGHTVLEWLRSGEFVLCEGLHLLLQQRDRGSAPLSLSPSVSISDEDSVFIVCKAIGYFFMQPVVAASVVVAFLRQPERKSTRELEELLLDPLLLNYGGDTRDYLLAIPEADASYEAVRRALNRVEAYVKGLQSVGVVPELHPSERERQIERTRSADQMRAAYKDAHKKSIFYNLVSRSVVLHGRRTTSYLQRPDGPMQKFDMDLASHGMSIELPRAEASDPLGLDLMLLAFRTRTRAG